MGETLARVIYNCTNSEYFSVKMKSKIVFETHCHCTFFVHSDTDNCEGVDCQNGGTCVDEVAGYHCECVEGYSGDHCETSKL